MRWTEHFFLPLVSFFLLEINHRYIAKINGIGSIVAVMKQYSTDIDVLEQGCRAFINIGSTGEPSCSFHLHFKDPIQDWLINNLSPWQTKTARASAKMVESRSLLTAWKWVTPLPACWLLLAGVFAMSPSKVGPLHFNLEIIKIKNNFFFFFLSFLWSSQTETRRLSAKREELSRLWKPCRCSPQTFHSKPRLLGPLRIFPWRVSLLHAFSFQEFVPNFRCPSISRRLQGVHCQFRGHFVHVAGHESLTRREEAPRGLLLGNEQPGTPS